LTARSILKQFPDLTAKSRLELWLNWVKCLLREKPIAIYSDDLADLAKELNVNWKKTQQIASTTHPKAKFIRDVVDRQCILEALKQCEARRITTIIDLFGSIRLMELWGAVTDVPTEAIPHPEYELQIGWRWYRPLLTVKDSLEFETALINNPSRYGPAEGCVAIIQDVYQPVSKIMELFAEHHVEAAVVATQVFVDSALAGIHFDTMPYYYDAKKQLIVQATGATDHVWPETHRNGDWLRTRQAHVANKTFGWDTYRVISDTSIFRVALMTTPLQSDIPQEAVDPRSLIEERVLTAKTVKHKMASLMLQLTWQETIFGRSLKVFMPALRALGGAMVLKTRQNYQVATLHREVLQLMQKEEYEAFWTMVPFERSEILRDTITWLTWSDFHGDHADWNSAAQVLGDELSFFKALKTKMTSTLPWKRLVLALLLTGLGGLLFRKQLPAMWKALKGVAALIPHKEEQGIASAYWTFAETLTRNNTAAWTKFYDWASSIMPGTDQAFKKRLFYMLVVSLAPIYEEAFKKYVPGGLLFIATVEASATYAQTTMMINEGTGYAIFPAMVFTKCLLHAAMTYSSRPVFYHALWNTIFGVLSGVGDVAIGSAVVAFLTRPLTMAPPPPESPDQFMEDHADVVSHLEEYAPIRQLEESEAFLPATTAAPEYPDCPVAQDAVRDVKPQEGIHLLLATTQCFYRPSGPLNLWHAYQQRNLEEVPTTIICERVADPPLPHQEPPWTHCLFAPYVPTQCPIDKAWRVATRLMLSKLSIRIDDIEPLHSLEWIAHFNGAAKKARAREAIENRNNAIVAERSGIFLKGDEVLFGRDTGLKGRTVKSVDPTIQALTFKAVDIAMKRVKDIFDGKTPFTENTWTFTFAVGSGKTAEELDTWFVRSLDWVTYGNNRMAAIFAGDDFFALVHRDQRIGALENDFAKFDRTQGVHALGSEYRVLRALGMSPFQCKRLFKTMLSSPRYESKKYELRMNLPMPPQRATGGPDTTIGNTLTNMMSVLYFLASDRSLEELPLSQLRLGFLAKLQAHHRPNLATFLKGWWVPGVDGYVWVPLPSQVIKLGKIMTDPQAIFKQLPAPDAWKAAAASMAASYGYVPREYPILGAFLDRYTNLTSVTAELKGEESFRYRVKRTETARIDRAETLTMVAERYSTTEAEIEEVELEILQTPFPGIMTHALWAVIARRDYG